MNKLTFRKAHKLVQFYDYIWSSVRSSQDIFRTYVYKKNIKNVFYVITTKSGKIDLVKILAGN